MHVKDGKLYGRDHLIYFKDASRFELTSDDSRERIEIRLLDSIGRADLGSIASHAKNYPYCNYGDRIAFFDIKKLEVKSTLKIFEGNNKIMKLNGSKSLTLYNTFDKNLQFIFGLNGFVCNHMYDKD